MRKVYKHITIYQSSEEFNDKPVYGIMNTKHGDLLGYLFYEKRWKQFIFQATAEGGGTNPIFSTSCLRDIIDFIENEIK